MTTFVKNNRREFQFDGSIVKVVLKPIRFEDLMIFASLPADEESRLKETLPFFKKLVSKYVKELDFKDANGEDITVEDICESAFLMPLMIDIANSLAEDGRIKDPPVSGAV